MFKSKTKYTWEGWESSGEEAWVFAVSHPRELMGVHAILIDKELKESEKIEQCLYSPRVSTTSTPFGLTSEASSWGVCVTDKRFIISQNRHVKDIEPVVTSIDFDDILYFHIGNVLLLSWFSITYVKDGKLNSVPIIFASNGKYHFEKALRAYKKYRNAINADEFSINTFWVGSFLYKIRDSIHRNHLKTLISTNEKCISTFSCRYLFGKVVKKKLFSRKEKVFYPTSKATVLFTNKSIMIAYDSLEFSIGSSVDVLMIPLDRVAKVFLSNENIENGMTHKLRVSFLTEVKDNTLDISLISLDENAKISINNLQSIFNKK